MDYLPRVGEYVKYDHMHPTSFIVVLVIHCCDSVGSCVNIADLETNDLDLEKYIKSFCSPVSGWSYKEM